MNYKGIIKKQSFIITISVIVMAIILIGTSYALFIHKDNSDNQVISSGTLIVSYEGSSITTVGGTDGSGNLLEIEPIDEATVNTQEPYKIKVNNNGTLALKYNIIIYTGSTNTLAHSNFSYKYKDNGSYTQSAALTSLPKVDPSQTNMNQIRYKLTSEPFILNAGQEATHEIYVWVDSDRIGDNLSDEEIVDLKIAVEGEATDPAVQPLTAVQTITDLATTDNTIVDDETTDHNLRYIGANPNNYVSFNNELWRIIGVMNNIETAGGETEALLKIIRSESIGQYSWDTSVSSINNGYGINQWGESGTYEGADLMRELNTDYLGNLTVGTDGKWYNGSNNTKTADKPSTTLNADAQNKIESIIWKLGSPTNNNGVFDTNWNDRTSGIKASSSYARERANTSGKLCSSGTYCTDSITRVNTWTGKVALAYPSDYLYATSGGNTTQRSTCLNTTMRYWLSDAPECSSNDWLGYVYVMLPPAAYSTMAHLVFRVDQSVYDSNSSLPYDVSPVVFLKSSVKITGGTGTQADPYTLG